MSRSTPPLRRVITSAVRSPFAWPAVRPFRAALPALAFLLQAAGPAAAVLLATAGTAHAGEPCQLACGDLTGDGRADQLDLDPLLACLEAPPAAGPPCHCADIDGNGLVNLADVAAFQRLVGGEYDDRPPACSGVRAATANLTAYRPQHGPGYAPFARTAVAELDELDPLRGPGIRVHAPGDVDPAGEDDLIEVELAVDPPGAALALRRTDAALRVWTSRNRQSGSEIAFIGDKTAALPLQPAQAQLTLWVEWAAGAHGTATLTAEAPLLDLPKDALVFHTFRGIVLALGGENQVPSDPPDPNSGTFVAAQALYRSGYDVHMYDEDHVAADGSGAVYNEAVTAIRDRGVTRLAIYGYSHGGGSTYDLAERLDINRAGLGVFEIEFTSYVDSVSNNSDVDTAMELRRPPASGYHLNHYQHGSLFQDFNLDGGPVPSSNPPPTGLDVETTPWGAGSTHFTVDDYVQVLDLLKSTMQAALEQP